MIILWRVLLQEHFPRRFSTFLLFISKPAVCFFFSIFFNFIFRSRCQLYHSLMYFITSILSYLFFVLIFTYSLFPVSVLLSRSFVFNMYHISFFLPFFHFFFLSYFIAFCVFLPSFLSLFLYPPCQHPHLHGRRRNLYFVSSLSAHSSPSWSKSELFVVFIIVFIFSIFTTSYCFPAYY